MALKNIIETVFLSTALALPGCYDSKQSQPENYSALETQIEELKKDDSAFKSRLEDLAILTENEAVIQTKYPYTEFKEMLKSKDRFLGGERREKEFRKIWYSISEEERKLFYNSHTTELTEKQKKELKDFYKKNPLSDEQKKEMGEKFIWKQDFDNPLSPTNRILYEATRGLRIIF